MAKRPSWVPAQYHDHWDRPWTDKAARATGFRKLLGAHGYLSPHFTKEEWKCHDGTHVPKDLLTNAHRHAFNLEKFRHALGDIPLSIMSAYRTPAYNRKIGGASKSRHMKADATDFDRSFIVGVGRSRFFAAAEKVFANGGVGSYPGGSGHVDSRGYKARWSSF